jgi:hypothetical protein
MKLKTESLERQLAWVSCPCPIDHHVLKSTWAFKLMWLPDGTLYLHKFRFCVCGDLQIAGIDFFENYTPVVQWSKICLLLFTVLAEGWNTQHVDYTNAFSHAEIHEEVYV